jgi:hypothetical protein
MWRQRVTEDWTFTAWAGQIKGSSSTQLGSSRKFISVVSGTVGIVEAE